MPIESLNWSSLLKVQCQEKSPGWECGKGRLFHETALVKQLKYYSSRATAQNGEMQPKLYSTEIKGRLAYVERSSHTQLHEIGSISCKWGLHYCSLIGPNSSALISQLCAFWLVIIEPLWLVGKDAKEDIAVQLQLDVQGLGLIRGNTKPGASLYGLAQLAGAYCTGWQLSCGFSLICSVHDRPLQTMAARLWLGIWAQVTTKSPSQQVFCFSGLNVKCK